MGNSLVRSESRVVTPLFQPNEAQIAASQLTDFIAFCRTHTGRSFADYTGFERFCREEYRAFWQLFLAWAALPVSGNAIEVCRGDVCETAQFFPEIHLNYVDALLAGPPDALALIGCHRDRPVERLTRRDVRDRVGGLVTLLRRLDVQAGDRVVAIARNNIEVNLAALACAAIGAVFSSCGHDMGPRSIGLRFELLRPVVLFANLSAEVWDVGQPLSHRVGEVLANLPTVRAVIALDGGACDTDRPIHHLADCAPCPLVSQRLPFNHPLFILFSSGTTGAPKCIVHGVGGTLLEHLKEHRLHCDLRAGERLFFQTTCGWMMWNWQLSALATGAQLVLYDGPLDTPDTLWRLVAEQRVTLFGTNPAYLQFCETAGCQPWQFHDFDDLRGLLSTGSILHPHQFDWVYQQVKPIPVQSISGGTDIIGCFVLGNPNLPVYRGEAQCRSLGLDIQAADTSAEGVGELICANPFPSRPLGFLDDAEGRRFHASYFSQHPGVWTHGDLIELTASGGAILHGRSDGVLNIRGIRIGPAEIYRLLRDIPGIIEAMAVEQRAPQEPGGSRLILLVVLRRPLDVALTTQIRQHLMTRGVAAMVPAQIIQLDALPETHSGKRSEAAARDAVNGWPIRNRDALRNPECLTGITQHRTPAIIDWPREEPNELLEAWLARVCQRAYGVPSIEWSDSLLQFGDSLTFLNLYLELGRHVGRPLPWLLTTPTIARLAAIIRNEHVEDDEGVVIRAATCADMTAVLRLLHTGFPDIPMAAWTRLFDYAWTATPPTYGLVLEANEVIVGFLGAIYVERTIRSKPEQVCNLTSWYIAPAYRGWGAAMLNAMLALDPSSTYTVLTAAPLPKAICRAMRFTDIVDSSLALPPLWHLRTLSRRPEISFQPQAFRCHLSTAEQRILDDHVATDCLHVLVRAGSQQAYMVIKRRRYRLHRWLPHVPASKVLYCGAPAVVAAHLEWVKLAILRRQRTLALVVSARWFAVPPSGWRVDSHMLMRSAVLEPSDLDLLYSEVCLLPV